MWLRVASGPDAGRQIEVSGELVLGRERGVDFVVRDPRASRRHASVSLAGGGGLQLRDLGSANGTFLDGEPVSEVTLNAGDRFTIADTEIEVLAAEPSAPAGPGSERAPSEAAKQAAAAALVEAARAGREARASHPPARTGSAAPAAADAPPPTYSMIGRLIEQRTRGHRRATWAAVGVAAVAVGLVSFLLATGGSDEGRVPQVVRALTPSTTLVEVTRGGARTATGSGWVLDAGDGLVVTNAHVVNEGDAFSVGGDGRSRPAQLLAAAPCEDLALLRVRDSAGLRTAPLGSGVEQGETVVALGYPADAGAGTTLAATTGVVSAASTSFRDPAPDVPAYPEVVQTDTALNPGNSGGPLANLEGRVIGVNAAARTSGSGGRPLQNQNYAIPIDRARRVLEGLRAGRSSGWLGVSFGYPSVEDLAEEKLPPGLFITGTVPGTPAAKAGLETNDLLLQVNGREVGNTLQGFCDAAGALRSGQTVTLSVQGTDGRSRQVRVQMA